MIVKVRVQQWEESEAGWGTRPDGYSIHVDEEERITYLAGYVADRTGPAPAEYDRPTGDAYDIELTHEHPLAVRLGEARVKGHLGVRVWKTDNGAESLAAPEGTKGVWAVRKDEKTVAQIIAEDLPTQDEEPLPLIERVVLEDDEPVMAGSHSAVPEGTNPFSLTSPPPPSPMRPDAVCQRNVTGEVIGALCPDCGHNGMFHPGANSFAECLLCLIEANQMQSTPPTEEATQGGAVLVVMQLWPDGRVTWVSS